MVYHITLCCNRIVLYHCIMNSHEQAPENARRTLTPRRTHTPWRAWARVQTPGAQKPEGQIQGPADLQSAALTSEPCTHVAAFRFSIAYLQV